VLCVGLFFSEFALSQDFSNANIVTTEKGDFLVHKVEKGQTLYAISKMYSVSVEDIQKANPDIEEYGVRIDQTILIPMAAVNKKDAKKSDIQVSGDTIYHEVLKKETLYALSVKYEIPVEQIEAINPEVKNGLKVGMIIKIPTAPKNQSVSTSEQFQKPTRDSLILHEVQPKETLYSLSKRYEVSTDEIQMVNGGLPQGLQVGSTIRIPVTNPKYTEKVTEKPKEDNYSVPIMSSDTLRIAVFLPFCTDKNETSDLGEKSEKLYNLTQISLGFYRGLNMALDSLSRLGLKVKVRYYDTKNDTLHCNKLLNSIQPGQYDLFIGPLFPETFACAVTRTQQLNVPIVSPVKVSSSLLLGNPSVIKSYSSSPSLVIKMANYAATRLADSNVVIISGSDRTDFRYAEIFQKHLHSATGDSIPIHKLWQASAANVGKLLNPNKENHVFLISSNEGFVSTALSTMYQMSRRGQNITVYGIDNWQNFKTLDTDYLNQLNVSYPIQRFMDYQGPKMIDFIQKYREMYFTDPSITVVSAFDVGMYFGQTIYQHKANWKVGVDQNRGNGLATRFDFIQIDSTSGFENQGGYILQYRDFTLILNE
jgi:LysM repeat protein/ABC-type branched-subunit amino acid transport system substrate-binding protein